MQQVESGAGDRLLSLLDREAQNVPAARALVRDYESLVEGGPVKVSKVQFRSEVLDGRLLVTGYMTMEVGAPAAAPGKEFSLQAEFASRDGAIVMTRLARGPGSNAPARAR